MRFSALLVVLLLLLGTTSLRAKEGSIQEDWTTAVVEAVKRLEGLAKQAHSRKLYQSRDALCERLLSLDPEHAEARAWLKYKRRDGAWVRKRYTQPKDRGSKAAALEQEQADKAWLSWWRQELLDVYEAAREAKDRRTQASVLEAARVWLPDEPEFRALAGEVRYEQGGKARWILRDSQRALKNRARYLLEARNAARAVPDPKPGQLEQIDRGGQFSWPVVIQGKTVRLLGNVSKQEMALHHQIAESAAAVFRSVFGQRGQLPSVQGRYSAGYPLYIASTLKSGNAFMASEPGVTKRDMEFLQSLVATYLGKRPGGLVKSDDEETRLEATSRTLQGEFQVRRLAQSTASKGAWASEAVTHYLAWLQVRTRRIFTVADKQGGRYTQPGPGVPTWEERMADQSVDWHHLAAEAIGALSVPDLHRMAATDGNDLKTLEMLAGYGLAVFVLEAKPERSVAFFHDVASQQQVDLDVVLKKHLGKDLTTLRPHLLRWLKEMGDLSPAPGPVR